MYFVPSFHMPHCTLEREEFAMHVSKKISMPFFFTASSLSEIFI